MQASAGRPPSGKEPLEERKEDKDHHDPPQKSFWQRYRGLIIVVIVLIVVFLVVVIILVVRRSRARSIRGLPPGVKLPQNYADDFSDKLTQFQEASADIRQEVQEANQARSLPSPRPIVSALHHHGG